MEDWDDANQVYVQYMWQSRVEIDHIPLRDLTVLPRSKRCSAVLPLRAGLIRMM